MCECEVSEHLYALWTSGNCLLETPQALDTSTNRESVRTCGSPSSGGALTLVWQGGPQVAPSETMCKPDVVAQDVSMCIVSLQLACTI